MERYSDYDAFARIYNAYWGGFAVRVVPILQQLALDDYPAGVKILDLCCGTGQLARELTERGYVVTGVDGSEQMLQHARQNAPNAAFVCADARAFELPTDFAVAASSYDSLNHLLALDDLRLAFGNVYRHLSEGGVFVFDMNLDAGFHSRWVGSFNIVSDSSVVVIDSRYDDAAKLATMDITLFTLDEPESSMWRRSDVTLTQRAYAVDALVAALGDAGFAEIEVFDAREHFAMRDEGRAFFRAKKA